MRKIRKLIGSLLGGVTAAVVITVAGALGVTVEAELAAAIAVILAAVGTWIAPANEVEA